MRRPITKEGIKSLYRSDTWGQRSKRPIKRISCPHQSLNFTLTHFKITNSHSKMILEGIHSQLSHSTRHYYILINLRRSNNVSACKHHRRYRVIQRRVYLYTVVNIREYNSNVCSFLENPLSLLLQLPRKGTRAPPWLPQRNPSTRKWTIVNGSCPRLSHTPELRVAWFWVLNHRERLVPFSCRDLQVVAKVSFHVFFFGYLVLKK